MENLLIGSEGLFTDWVSVTIRCLGQSDYSLIWSEGLFTLWVGETIHSLGQGLFMDWVKGQFADWVRGAIY